MIVLIDGDQLLGGHTGVGYVMEWLLRPAGGLGEINVFMAVNVTYHSIQECKRWYK
jgi:hypothetical protein